MAQKKIPMRMCVVCRQSKPKAELVRILKTEDGGVLADGTGKLPGRGAYICADEKCMERAYGTKVLQKTIRAKMDEQTYDELKKVIAERGL